MGGWGSTRWGGHGRRLTVEETPRLSVEKLLAALPESGYVGPLRFVVESADGHRQEVDAARMVQPFGGWRWSIMCPACGKECRALFRPRLGTSWACRRCHRLAYYSQRLKRYWRLNQRLDKCWEQMGGTEDDLAVRRWPRRPKRMHRTTYERLRAEWNALNNAVWDEGAGSIARFLARLGA